MFSHASSPNRASAHDPLPTVTVDMGQYLARGKEPGDMERLWIDYVTELASEAQANPAMSDGRGRSASIPSWSAPRPRRRRWPGAGEFQAAEARLGDRRPSGRAGRGRGALTHWDRRPEDRKKKMADRIAQKPQKAGRGDIAGQE